MDKRNKISIGINYACLILGILLLFYSGWNFLIKKVYVPNLLLFVGSIMFILMFSSLIVARFTSKNSISWMILALFNSALIVYLYFYPDLLKELYPLSIWIFLTILIASLQRLLERTRKKYHSIMRIFNFGLILTLIPVYMLKTGSPLVWTIFSWLTLVIMLVNLTVFLLPNKVNNQSR
jgi:hypothetical protein